MRLDGKAHTGQQGGGALRLGDVALASRGRVRVHYEGVVSVAVCLAAAIARVAAALAQAEDAWGGGRALLCNVRGGRRVDAVCMVGGWRCRGIEWILAAEWGQREVVQVGVGAASGTRAWGVHGGVTYSEGVTGEVASQDYVLCRAQRHGVVVE